MGDARNRAETFAVDEGAIQNACRLARDFAADAGLGDDMAARLCIIVEELVANLVDYAGLSPADQLTLELGVDDRGVRLTLTDPGPPFDPRIAPPPGELPPDRGGGAGLAMVQAWSHIETYARDTGINRLTLHLRT